MMFVAGFICGFMSLLVLAYAIALDNEREK